MKTFNKLLLLSAAVAIFLPACQKDDRPELGEYPTDDSRPPLKEGPLRFFVPFNEDPQKRYEAKDSISGDPAQVHPFDLTDGVNGKAVQFNDAGRAIKYMSVNDFNQATSFSIAFWMKNTEKGRTEFLFNISDPKYEWSQSAIFLLMEHGSPTEVTMKFYLMDQWLEFPDGNKFPRPVMDGEWHHLAFVYDEATSKMTYYFDGEAVPGPSSATDVKKDGNPRGPVDFSTIKNLVLGGANKHANLPGPTDSWLQSYTGAMDQFRIYNKALTASEVKDLFTAKE
ncbi:MAG TPA: LamG domain-containing protein [Flavihumibacter sp.]